MLSDIELLKEYESGKRKGITINEDCFFMPVRITGLGKTIRVDEDLTLKNLRNELKLDDSIELQEVKKIAKEKGLNISDYVEYYEIDRRPQEFASKEALDAYNGLAIVKEHPLVKGVKSKLNFSNFKNNVIIGSVIKAFLKNKSVWGVAKIFDLSLLDQLDELQSTSPAVTSCHIESDGKLIEIPSHFNHLAFVDKGHWDVKGDEGYDASALNFNLDKGEDMAEEAKTENKADEANEDKTDAVTEQIDDESVAEKVEAKVEAEGEKTDEASQNETKQDNKELSMAKVKADNEVKTLTEEEEKLDDDTLKVENVDADDKEDEDEDLKADSDDKEDEDEEFKADSDDKEDEDETIVDSECNELDEERANILDSFRSAIDMAEPELKLKMPYIDGRLSPSAVITKILKLNSGYIDSKYQDLIADKRNSKMLNNYGLLVDSYNNLLDNISKATENVRKNKSAMAKKSGYWVNTDKSHVKIDRNF